MWNEANQRTWRGHYLHMATNAASALFLRELRRALYRLYDPAALRGSPLVELFGLEQRGDSPSALRRILLEAIEALKPGPNVPSQSNAWRIYHLLSERFAEQSTQREVATDLALSVRQLRRQEHLALRVLADYLWSRYNLQDKMPKLAGAKPLAAETTGPQDEAAPSREQELEWLKRSSPLEAVSVAELITSALKVVGPLMTKLGVSADCALPADLPPAMAQRTAMRQALVNLLTAAARTVPGGQVHISAMHQAQWVKLFIKALAQAAVRGTSWERYQEDLEMAKQLVALSGGELQVVLRGEAGLFDAQLALSAAARAVVLVIEDNSDALRLMERYLAGTRYHFVGVRNPEEALARAAELRPQIILLDVMLPGIDGWELLGRLREHPKTRGIPIIACTILPQEQLALTLGAAAFLRKPVSREALLAALDRQLGPSLPGSA